MSGHQHATLEDTVYFWFAANDTSGSGGDGATPLFDVREAGAAASAIPLLSGTPALLTHVNFPAGCYEVAVAATAGNGFAADDTFAVFCTLAVDSQNPSGFVGSCKLGPIPANTTQISGDSGAADNLEAMYDGTGYVDPTAPASRAQVANIGAVSGGSVNFSSSEDNSGGTIDPLSTAFVGVETNDFTDTAAANGVYHIIDDSSNVIDVVYGFQIGGSRTATDMTFTGFVNNSSPTDDLTISAFDHVGSAWEVIGTLTADSNTDNITFNIALLSKHTGAGSEIGKVYVRFNGSSLNSDASLNTDQFLVSAVNVGQSVGYALGSIWIDTANGVAGTEDFVNGVADNAVDSIADAKTLSGSLGIPDFHVRNGSSITLAESTANESYFGDNWTLALNNQAMAGGHFNGADVSGVQTGAGVGFHGGTIGTVTLADDFHIDEAGLSGTITLAAGTSELFLCHSVGSPVLDFGAAIGNTTIHCHRYAGSLEIHNFGDSGTDILNLTGEGKLTINSNSSGGTINLEGDWEIVNNAAAGAMTINLNSAMFDYEGGAIWINTGASNTSTIPGFDGTVERPVSTIAAAKTLSTSLGITDFHVINGSSITLAATSDNESYFGDNWTLALGGQQTAGAHFQGADVSGIQTGSGMGLDGGELVTCTLADDAHMDEVGLSGTITLPAGSVEFFNCHHDGAVLPILDFGDAVGSTIVHMHSYHGGIEVQNMGDSGTDIVHLDGMGRLDINANCTGGTINVRGTWDINDSSSGAVTLVQDDVAADVIATKVITDALTSAGAANLALSAAGIIGGTAATGTLSTTVMTSDLSGYLNDELIGRVIVWTGGTADGQASDITDYAATNGTLTYTAITTAPLNNDTFVII